MNKNVGGYDRMARFVVGPILIVVGAVALGGVITLAAGTLGFVLAGVAALVGLVLTVTAATQWCPLNAVFGLNTYKGDPRLDASTEEPSTTGE